MTSHFDVRLLAVTFAAVVLLGGLNTVKAQTQIPDFIERQGLSNTNLGRSAIAVQRTCGALIRSGITDIGGNTQGDELYRRCNELVQTAGDLDPNDTRPTPRSLGYSQDNELLAAFQQVNGEEVQASANLAQTAAYDQFSNVAARLSALRGAASSSISSVAANGGDFMFGSGGGAAADDGLPFGPWGWFLRGTYTSGERDRTENPNTATGEENGFDFDQYGLTVGIDYRRGSSVWGFALGYNRYEITMKDRPSASGIQTPIVAGGTVEADSVTGTIFFDASSQNNVYFTALAGFGGQSFDMARNFIYFSQNTTDPTVVNQTRRLLATPDGDAISASFTLGRTFINNRLIFDPYIGLALDRVTIDRFSESDSGNVSAGSSLDAMQLAFDEQDIDSLRSKLGFQLSTVINTNFGSVRPLFAADWYHEFEDDPRVIKTKYALEDSLASSNPDEFSTGFDNCTSCFDLISEQPVSDYFVVGLGIAAVTQRGFQSFLMVEGLVGHDFIQSYAVTIGLRSQF